MESNWYWIVSEARSESGQTPEYYETFINGQDQPITFGTAYTYLKYYRMLPFEIIKQQAIIKANRSDADTQFRFKSSFKRATSVLNGPYLKDDDLALGNLGRVS
ncbi:hypothetical protein RF11_02762 [Thelohanellus kitauei]|uniref:Uncharacterized protein n=1 Tax=Thelohanellus kitauei TaxID=669202 RepID=A0A0C2MUJ3_THEKT|nr:hypothetical protein RF11_02762 [Thelohanellus kitauei]